MALEIAGTSDGIFLNGLTSNYIIFGAVGTGAPTFTNRSLGSKVVLYPSLTESQVDYAIGISSGIMWFSVPAVSGARHFYWYAGTTKIMDLTDASQLYTAELFCPSIKGTDANGDMGLNMFGGNIQIGATSFYDGLNGRLGVNTLIPATTLDVNGISTLRGATYCLGGNIYVGAAATSVGGIFLQERATGYSEQIIFLDGDGATQRSAIGKDTSDRLYFRSGDNTTIDFMIGAAGDLMIIDGITAPATASGYARIYVDTADGDLKVKFGDGHVTVIAADT
jgi:hypothetical protein